MSLAARGPEGNDDEFYSPMKLKAEDLKRFEQLDRNTYECRLEEATRKSLAARGPEGDDDESHSPTRLKAEDLKRFKHLDRIDIDLANTGNGEDEENEDDTVLHRVGPFTVTEENLTQLTTHGTLMVGETLNAYLELLRAENPRTWIADPLMMTALTKGGTGYNKDLVFERPDLDWYNTLLWPVHDRGGVGHWTLIIATNKKKKKRTVTHVDSCGNPGTRKARAAARSLRECWEAQHTKPGLTKPSWKIITGAQHTQQGTREGLMACGIFTAARAQAAAQQSRWQGFRPGQVAATRRHMAESIRTGKLQRRTAWTRDQKRRQERRKQSSDRVARSRKERRELRLARQWKYHYNGKTRKGTLRGHSVKTKSKEAKCVQMRASNLTLQRQNMRFRCGVQHCVWREHTWVQIKQHMREEHGLRRDDRQHEKERLDTKKTEGALRRKTGTLTRKGTRPYQAAARQEAQRKKRTKIYKEALQNEQKKGEEPTQARAAEPQPQPTPAEIMVKENPATLSGQGWGLTQLMEEGRRAAEASQAREDERKAKSKKKQRRRRGGEKGPGKYEQITGRSKQCLIGIGMHEDTNRARKLSQFRAGAWNLTHLGAKRRFNASGAADMERSRGNEKEIYLQAKMEEEELYILGLNETKRKSEVTEYHNGYTLIVNQNEKNVKRFGVGAMLSPNATKAWRMVGGGTEGTKDGRLMWLKTATQQTGRQIIWIVGYAPQPNEGTKERRKFYTALDKVLLETPAWMPVVLMGDLNAKVGRAAREDAEHPRAVVGEHNKHAVDDNGRQLIKTCEEHAHARRNGRQNNMVTSNLVPGGTCN